MISNETRHALSDIAAERMRQDEKWGGPEHDDQHSLSEFADFIQERAIAIYKYDRHENKSEARRRLIQIGALAVAAIEHCDRAAERAKEAK